MSSYTAEVGNKLNTLLENTFNAEKGYLKAAENSEHPNLKSFFAEKSKERYDFGYELKEEIRKFGQMIEKVGNTSGTVQRAWMDLKTVFSFDNDEAMLEEALKVEESAIKEYNEVLENTGLPPTTTEILKKQSNIIKANLSTIRVLADRN